MPTELIASLIALSSVAISVTVSLIISTRQIKTELKKLRAEIQQTYAGGLLEKRLQTYPILYKLLSDFDKVIRFGTLTQVVVSELFDHLLKWDSENAIFMSGNAVNAYHAFRMKLNNLRHMTVNEFEKEFTSQEKRKELRIDANRVEVVLKRDIGIYIVEFAGEDKKFETYRDIDAELKK